MRFSPSCHFRDGSDVIGSRDTIRPWRPSQLESCTRCDSLWSGQGLGSLGLTARFQGLISCGGFATSTGALTFPLAAVNRFPPCMYIHIYHLSFPPLPLVILEAGMGVSTPAYHTGVHLHTSYLPQVLRYIFRSLDGR